MAQSVILCSFLSHHLASSPDPSPKTHIQPVLEPPILPVGSNSVLFSTQASIYLHLGVISESFSVDASRS